MKKVVEKVLGFLIALIFWVAVLSVGQNVKAEVIGAYWSGDLTNYSYNDGSRTSFFDIYNSVEGSSVLCVAVVMGGYNTIPFDFIYENTVFEVIDRTYYKGGSEGQSYHYLQDLPVGTSTLKIKNVEGPYYYNPPFLQNDFYCIIDDEIGDFFSLSDKKITGNSGDYINNWYQENTIINSSGKIAYDVVSHSRGNGGDFFPTLIRNPSQNVLNSFFDIKQYYGFAIYNYELNSDSVLYSLDSSNQTFYHSLSSFQTLLFNKKEQEPEAPALLLFGSPYIWKNEIEFNYNTNKKYTLYLNTCNVYDTFDRASIQPKYSSGKWSAGNEVIKSKRIFIGPQQCKKTITFYDNYNTDETGEVYFDLYLYDVDNNIISTTSSNIMNFSTEERPDNFIDHFYDDPIIIDLGRLELYEDYTASTTRLYFTYDFTGQNPASTTVKLWDHRNATSTGFITNGPFSSTSTSFHYIDIPTPTEATNAVYRFVAERPGYPALVSKYFTINWSFYPQLDDILKKKICVEEVFDYSNICDGINTETTIGEWVCGIKTGFIKASVFLTYASCESLLKLNDSFEKFKTSFPFNIFFDLVGTFDRAIEEAEKENLDNSFDVPFIKKTATSSEFYMLPVVSSSSFSNLIGEENYNTYLLTIGFIWWIIIAVIIFLTVRK